MKIILVSFVFFFFLSHIFPETKQK
uniref:Uncharacterized protein n=1 Tax=Rhizophora mucronata TaxID=61149 RepID=A0A2P2JXF6_RHIMU